MTSESPSLCVQILHSYTTLVSPTAWHIFHVNRFWQSELLHLLNGNLIYALNADEPGFFEQNAIYFDPATDVLEVNICGLQGKGDVDRCIARLSGELRSKVTRMELVTDHLIYGQLVVPVPLPRLLARRIYDWVDLLPAVEDVLISGTVMIQSAQAMQEVEDVDVHHICNWGSRVVLERQGLPDVRLDFMGID